LEVKDRPVGDAAGDLSDARQPGKKRRAATTTLPRIEPRPDLNAISPTRTRAPRT
jgi:hypothetical protein